MKRIFLLLFVTALISAACSGGEGADPTTTSLVADESTITTTTAASTTTTTLAATTTSNGATTTSTSASAIIPGEDPAVDAVVLAYEVVFSSETGYEEKAPYLIDPTGLEETVAKYQETGESMGGVALAPKGVVINGDVADVTYDLLFGGTPTYPDLSGDAVFVEDTWKITREMFCGMMASARVGCPTS